MAVANPVHDEVSNKPTTPPGGLGRAIAWFVLAVVSVLWLRVVRDAWRIRSIVSEYLSVHGGYELQQIWPDHFRVFHDELMGVGADYFYPFAWGVILVTGLIWIGAAAITTTGLGRLRWAAIGAGAGALVLQLVVLGPALVTYINVTD